MPVALRPPRASARPSSSRARTIRTLAKAPLVIVGLFLVPQSAEVLASHSFAAQASQASAGSDAHLETSHPYPVSQDPASALDVLEADRLIRSIFASQEESRYEEAVRAYEDIVRSPGAGLDEEVATVRGRHFGALITVATDEAVRAAARQLQAGTGGAPLAEQILVWWRRQDPLPGTQQNERLEEHLARYVYAVEMYGDEGDRRGYDDRGEVLIRLGPPVERFTLEIPSISRAFDFQDVAYVPKLPDNEVWLYPNVHDEAYYFFMRSSRRGGYTLSLPSEVFPRRMLTGHDSRNRRGRAQAEVALSVLEGTYAQLALAHPFFGSIYDQISNYFGRPPGGRDDTGRFIQDALAHANALESESQGRRDRLVPVSVSNSRGITEDLPVDVRWARFLDDDGTTRTEIFWSLDGRRLPPSNRLRQALEKDGYTPSNAYLITFAAARQTPDYQTRDIEMRHFRIRPPADRPLDTQLLVLTGDTGRYHVGLQWNEYWTTDFGGDSVDVGALLKIGTVRIDSLEALHGAGRRLEASDLKPVYPGNATAYPHATIDVAAPPDLVFELYNLQYGPDDQTHYSIEYIVSRAGDRVATRVETQHSGAERSTKERIAIELGDAEAGEQIRLSVRATDEVTGEVVERTLPFRLR